jgi:hypothetical protein
MLANISSRMVVALSGDQLNQQVLRMKELDQIKSDLTTKAKLLTRALNHSGASQDEDLVWVPGGLTSPIDPGEANSEWIAKQRQHQRVWRRVRRMADEMQGSAPEIVREHMQAIGMVCRFEVEEQLERLQSKVRALAAAYKRIAKDFKTMVNDYHKTQRKVLRLSA